MGEPAYEHQPRYEPKPSDNPLIKIGREEPMTLDEIFAEIHATPPRDPAKYPLDYFDGSLDEFYEYKAEVEYLLDSVNQ